MTVNLEFAKLFAQQFLWYVILVIVASLYCGTAFAADPNAGKKIYNNSCATCHGDNGRGVIPNTPDFSRGEGLLKPNGELLREIQQGRRAMPGFDTILTDQEILDVIAYLRSLF